MTEWLASKFRYGKPAVNPVLAQRRREMQEQTHQERLNNQYNSALITCRMKEDELKDLRNDAREYLRKGQQREAALTMTRVKELENELQSDRGKLKNLEMQQKKIDSAHANLNQALLVDESAAELEHIAGAFEGIDLESAVDRVAEASHTLDSHNDLLSTPMFNGAAQIIDPDDIDADLAELQAQIDAEGDVPLDLPEVPVRAPSSGGRTRVQTKK